MQYKSSILSIFQWTLEIDLKKDFETIVFKDLVRSGIKNVNPKEAVFQYYNLLKRRVEQKPRHILYSREFKCPEKYKLALEEFEGKAKKGADLTPYLSEKLQRADYNDLLLNDWGIQHFHLSRRFRDDGLVARSQYLIFAKVTADTIYMIQVYDHNAEDVFSREELIRILADNWPEVIERYHIKGARELTEHFDDHDYSEIRKGRIQSFVELGENRVYGLMGGGYSTSGASLEALQQSDYWRGRLEVVQGIVVKEAEHIGKAINRAIEKRAPFCPMHIRFLWFDNRDTFSMCETNSGLIVRYESRGRRFWVGRRMWYECASHIAMPRAYAISHLSKKAQ